MLKKRILVLWILLYCTLILLVATSSLMAGGPRRHAEFRIERRLITDA